MKKLFHHTKKQVPDWEGYDSDGYDWDNPEGQDSGTYYEEELSDGDIEETEEYCEEEELSGEYIKETERYYGSEEQAGEYQEETAEYYDPEEQSEGYAEGCLEETEGYYAAEEEPKDYMEEAKAYYAAEEEPEGYMEEAERYYAAEEEPEGYMEEAERCYAAEEEPEGYMEEAERYYEAEEEPEGYMEEAERYYEAEEEPEGYMEEAERYYEAEEEFEGGVEESGEYYGSEEEFEGGMEEVGEYYGSEEASEEYMEESEECYGSEEQADVYGAVRVKNNRNINRQPRQNRFYKIVDSIRNMAVMDMVMLAAGVCVLVLLVMVGRAFFQKRVVEAQVADFANVGTELNGITIIGEKGISAVAKAEMERIAASVVIIEEDPVEEPPEDSKKDYEEIGYQRQVSVEPGFTSIQKDLKIKFINQKTNKLVANVPFSVTVTAPDGKTYIWSDDDMDGIIYKKDISPGSYKVVMESLTDSKYSGYNIPSTTKTVEVKEEIVYKKVDVVNEVKKETEIDVAKEDTKKNETVVESSLQDTVAWVESKMIGTTYNEVLKSSIPDPAVLAFAGNIIRLSQTENPVTEPTAEPIPEPTAEPIPEPTAEPTPEPTAEPTPEPTAEPTPEPTAIPTPEPTAIPTPEPTVTPTVSPSTSPVPAKGIVSVDNAALQGAVNAIFAVKASAAGFTEGMAVVYAIQSSNPSVAAASIDGSGNINITGMSEGTAVITVMANYENGTAETAATAFINVTIVNMAMTLDKTAATVFMQVPLVINASIANETMQDLAVTAQSSDTNVATVSVDNKAVSISGVAEGSAVITVSYTENGVTVNAACAVTVKKHPREDNVTLLKTGDGQQLYVFNDDAYREATYADYYTAEKFFVKGSPKYTGWQTIGGKVYYFTADSKNVTGEQVIQGAKYTFASDGSLVTGDGVLGIDVSKWNGSIDWNAVKNSGISYVIIRCGYRGSSEGKLIEDPKFESNIRGASAAGLKVGVYFFTQAVDEIEAVEEASMVLALIKNYTISYPVFIDVEASGGRGDKIDKATRTAVCKAFCQTIQSEGYTAGVYSNKLWLEGRIDIQSLNAYKVWLAQYSASPTYTGRYDLWQYKSTGSVSGISGNVDLNISYLGY